MQAPTRNSNLISQPNKDKIAKNKIDRDGSEDAAIGSQFTLQNKNQLLDANNINHQNILQKSKQFEIQNQESSPLQDDSKNGNISIDQLKQLMKNPQIAQFLKEQIEIQQKQQQSFQNINDTFGVKSGQKIDPQEGSDLRKDSLDQPNQQSAQKFNVPSPEQNQSSAQKKPMTVGNTESNMNSDTSQEIIKYQQEWAKQFHEQVTGMTNIERQELNAMMTANSNNTQGQRSSAMDRDQSSSQFITGNHGNSHEQIMMLPESAYTHNMQKLNEKINDTQTGPMTSVSTKVPGRHMPQSMTDSQPHDKTQGQSNIDFYNQQQLASESQVESVSPMSHALAMKELAIDEQQNEDLTRNIKQTEMPMSMQQQDQGSRNIMNGGKQLSFITVCSDVMDHDANLVLDHIREDSQASQKDEDDEYLTFQLCQGEVMDNEMANFIGIHMLNDGYLEGEQNSKNGDQDGGLNYQCEVTGAHFEFTDIHDRVRVLLDKRNVIDEAIRQEDERQKLVKNQQVLNKINKQKQLQKQKKFKTQVQNILKSAQQDNVSNDDYNNDLNDSIPNQTNHMMTDEDMFVMEDEDHLEQHHVTTNMKTNKVNLESQDNTSSNKNTKQNGNGGKIYNTHDGRQKQASEQQATTKATTNIIQTHDYNNQQPTASRVFKSSGQKGQTSNNFSSSHNQVKMMHNQTNEHEVVKNSMMGSNKQQNYSVKAVINHGHTVHGRFYSNQNQQKEKFNSNQISTMKTSNQSMYPAGGSFYQQSMKNNAKTFHVNPSQAVHQASSLASDHASKISQISKNSVAVQGTLTGKSQRIAGNSFGAIGQNYSKGGFAYTQNSGNNSNERQMQRKLHITGGPSGMKRGGINVSVGSGTHAKMDSNKQYNLQIKNQQQQDGSNQAFYGTKSKQGDGQHGASLSGHSQQSIAQRIQMQSPDDESDNAFEQLSHGLVPPGQQNNSSGVKQIFSSQGEKGHARVLSDDIKFNTNNIQKGQFPGGIAGTQIHTNQLSSLDGTHTQNTQAYNTALASQRDTVIQVNKANQLKNQKKNLTSFDNHKNAQKINVTIGKGSGKARLLENKDSKSLGGTTSTQGNSQLRQTAQFGPQMNLIKSQLPNTNIKGNTQSQYHSNDNKQRNQQKKIHINQQKVKSTEIRKNSKHTAHGESGSNGFGGYLREQYQSQGMPDQSHNMYAGVVLQNQGQSSQQYDESGSLNKRQAMMQQANQIAYQNNQQILINDKRSSKQANTFVAKNEGKGVSSNKSDQASQSHQSATGQHLSQGASIYSSQQQRKQKLIYNGGNLIGYDMGRQSNQNHLGQQQNQIGSQVSNMPPGYGLNRNISIDRTSQKGKYTTKQNVMLNQIDIKNQSNIGSVIHPKTVQSVSKKFANTGHGAITDGSDQTIKGQPLSTSGQLQRSNAPGKVGGVQSFMNQHSMKEPSPVAHGDAHNMGQQLGGHHQVGPMKNSKAQQNVGPGGVAAGNHLQSHSFDFRQQHRGQVNRISNYSVIRDGNKDEQQHGQPQHQRQASGIPADFNAQHAQPRYSHPNQGIRSNNLANNKMLGGPHQTSGNMGKNNLRSFDAQMSSNHHNKLMADSLQQANQITPGNSNIQTPSQINQKNKRNMPQQQQNINQRNNSSQFGTNISKTKSASLQNKKDGQSSSNSAVRTTGGLHGAEANFTRHSGGGNSGKQIINVQQSKQSQQNQQHLAGQMNYEHQKQAHDRGKMKQSSHNYGGMNQGQPGSHSFANPSNNAQMNQYDQDDLAAVKQNQQAFGQSFNNGGNNTSMTKDNFAQARENSNQNIANAIATKTKRLNAANRGVNCGTNARVNTFDNRGMQAQQQSQNLKGPGGGSQQQQFLSQMMKQPQVDPNRGQHVQGSGSQGGQHQDQQRLHSFKNVISNQQQVHQDPLSQLGQQYASTDSSHALGDNGSQILKNQRQIQQQQQYTQNSSQMGPGQYSGGSQQKEPHQVQNLDQSGATNGQHQSPILFAKFVNQFFLQ